MDFSEKSNLDRLLRDDELSKVSALWESGCADFSVGSTRVGIDYRLVNRGGIYHQALHHTSPAGP